MLTTDAHSVTVTRVQKNRSVAHIPSPSVEKNKSTPFQPASLPGRRNNENPNTKFGAALRSLCPQCSELCVEARSWGPTSVYHSENMSDANLARPRLGLPRGGLRRCRG